MLVKSILLNLWIVEFFGPYKHWYFDPWLSCSCKSTKYVWPIDNTTAYCDCIMA